MREDLNQSKKSSIKKCKCVRTSIDEKNQQSKSAIDVLAHVVLVDQYDLISPTFASITTSPAHKIRPTMAQPTEEGTTTSDDQGADGGGGGGNKRAEGGRADRANSSDRDRGADWGGHSGSHVRADGGGSRRGADVAAGVKADDQRHRRGNGFAHGRADPGAPEGRARDGPVRACDGRWRRIGQIGSAHGK